MLDVVEKLGCGNPGAICVLFQIISWNRDPYDLLLDMDDLELAGSRIWEAYKDICREDLEDFTRHVRNRRLC